ncbi:hypothetical protein PV735_46810 [Streptomyces turgidiscabies]|uniref:Uncharacterized protein n=2 Tax=Streptomyces turgidiscabies TaxID=85558 RepID=L7F1P5_STRT8|nr:hypothetical protein [Streptomyces turgidiscabies]ELP65074.1 hypothetical protein STRTUCAR8_00001 [Streptomyces turgidiscabies Car8]MDX3500133.1 hypothetical protein [Streptomyces turgidiscabies]GAQ77215.1 hypothetical protein T45_09031 [Streptomyces turgidiscabies]
MSHPASGPPELAESVVWRELEPVPPYGQGLAPRVCEQIRRPPTAQAGAQDMTETTTRNHMDDQTRQSTEGHENLPAVPGGQPGTAVEQGRTSAPPFAGDLVRTIQEASSALRVVSTLNPSSDITVSAHTALVCAGDTAAAALQAAADLAKEAPTLEIQALNWAKVPGPVEGTWEWHVILTVSARDPETGEYGGSTHHGRWS